MCASMSLSSSTSIWLRAPTTAAVTSRPRCPLGGGTPSMQLLSHLCVAASHWPTAIHGRHQATRPWPLTRFHGRTLSFFHEVRVAHRLHGPTSHCFMLCASECCTAQQAAVVHVPPPPPPPPPSPTSPTSTTTSTTTTRTADEVEPSPRSRDCCVCC